MYIKHLFQTQEILGLRLLSYHNIWFYSELMAAIRKAVQEGGLSEVQSRLMKVYPHTLEGIAR